MRGVTTAMKNGSAVVISATNGDGQQRRSIARKLGDLLAKQREDARRHDHDAAPPANRRRRARDRPLRAGDRRRAPRGSMRRQGRAPATTAGVPASMSSRANVNMLRAGDSMSFAPAAGDDACERRGIPCNRDPDASPEQAVTKLAWASPPRGSGRRSTPTRSATRSASSRLCVEMMTAWPRFARLQHHVADEPGAVRIEARRRLVEQHDRRIVQQRPREGDSLLQPLRQLTAMLSARSARPKRSSGARHRGRPDPSPGAAAHMSAGSSARSGAPRGPALR